MIRLEDIKTGLWLTGLAPGMIVSVIAAVPIGTGAVQVIYKLPDGTIRERLVGSADIHTLAVATTERPWSFDGDGEAFKLAVEAKRIDLAFLFDPMMAVHTSNVEPLPHQITAVYESMLPRRDGSDWRVRLRDIRVSCEPTGLLMLMLLYLTPAAHAAEGGGLSFAAARSFGAGVIPSCVVVGDFDKDGKPDLAVANLGFFSPKSIGSVSILLSTGDGTFQAAVNYATGKNTDSMALGDFDGNGTLDLAVANGGDASQFVKGSVSVLLGNGNGTFQAAINVSIAPGSLSVGDFNGDGKLDLAVGGVSVLLGNGDGTFQTAKNVSTVSGNLVAGDLNRDGKPDLAVAGNGVWVLFGKGDGTFQAALNYGAGSRPVSVAVGDLNGDGQPDLAAANYDSANISILLGKGDGNFQPALNYGAGSNPSSVAVGDFNGDAQPDLAVANYGSSNVSFLLGKGDGNFQEAVNHSVGRDPRSIAVGDFNGDGQSDVAVANYAGGVTVLLNTSVSSPVKLAILRSGTDVTVTWPFPSTGLVLQSTTNLSPPNWQLALEMPTTNAARLEVIAPANLGARYFRLHKP